MCGHPLPGFLSYARGVPLLVARSMNPDSLLWREVLNSQGCGGRCKAAKGLVGEPENRLGGVSGVSLSWISLVWQWQ